MSLLKGVRTSLPRIFLPGRTTPVMKRPSVFHIKAAHYNGAGDLLWQGDWEDNMLHDEGEQYMLARCFATGAANYTTTFTQLYIGVDDRGTTMAESNTLASLVNEGGASGGRTTGGGYSRKAVNTDGSTAPYFDISGTMTPTLPGGSTASTAYYATINAANEPEWTASSGWTEVSSIFIASHATGVTSSATQRLLATVKLDANRTLVNNDTLTVNIKLALSEVPE